MKKQKITKDGVSKASIRARVHEIERDIIDFLTRYTVKDALTKDFSVPDKHK